MQRVPVGENVNHLAYSSSSEMYVLGTSHKTEFKLPEDDELHPEWRNEGMFGPNSERKRNNLPMLRRDFVFARSRPELAQGCQSQNVVNRGQV